ncbi:MAG TPA: zinc ribbon domain-containing protein [Pyrinomonadaceae bacterium]|jgi:hypothetical protein
MAETLVENRTCSKCGVDVRKGALFCYNCGGSVAPDIPAPENQETNGEEVFQEQFVDENLKEIDKIPEKKTEVAEAADAPVKKPDMFEEAKLKTAASLRRKSKTPQKQRIEEVVWTGHENAPNGWFIVIALVLTLGALGIFWLAMWLK